MMNADTQETDDALWQRLVTAERQFYFARKALLRSGADLPTVLRAALGRVAERDTALRLLLDPSREEIRRELFHALMDLAAVAHRDLQLVREVISSMDTQWLTEHIPGEVERVLNDSATEEEYRRLAELLRMMCSPALALVIAKAAASDNPDIREVAEDFQPHEGRSAC